MDFILLHMEILLGVLKEIHPEIIGAMKCPLLRSIVKEIDQWDYQNSDLSVSASFLRQMLKRTKIAIDDPHSGLFHMPTTNLPEELRSYYADK